MPLLRSRTPGAFPMVFLVLGLDPKNNSGAIYDFSAPLELMIPSSVTYNYKPIIKEYTTRGAIIQEHWGDDLDELTVEGATAAFLHPDCGLTRLKARETIAYANFLKLVEMYRNNGGFYDVSGAIIERASRGNPAGTVGGTIICYYSMGLYDGFFSDFSYSEDATQPYSFNFDFTFKIQKSIMVY